ncbi:hypothetical protein FA95DRAFT_1655455 [Auriscalpium vulgare]|uniref:Uncharacterized protein n=1 Tax=Auriscalpium vulgare TaxID=40419 RepID=A0ACB8R6Q0_9AGAM|nr:hypothetical protein FA95DRAFT_1655455 [Auriscalpium vulgare]
MVHNPRKARGTAPAPTRVQPRRGGLPVIPTTTAGAVSTSTVAVPAHPHPAAATAAIPPDATTSTNPITTGTTAATASIPSTSISDTGPVSTTTSANESEHISAGPAPNNIVHVSTSAPHTLPAATAGGHAHQTTPRTQAAELAALHHQVAELQTQLARATVIRSHEAAAALPRILRPAHGNAGDGFNLRHEMGLDEDKDKYLAIRAGVRSLVAAAQLDPTTHWAHQDVVKLGKVFQVARDTFPYLRRFPNDWATEEFVKSSMKNKRAYAVRTGRPQLLAAMKDALRQRREGSDNSDSED